MRDSEDMIVEDGAGNSKKYLKNAINFVGKGTGRSKYIIIPKSDESLIREVVDKHITVGLDDANSEIEKGDKFLTTKPGALISVTGGAQDFDMASSKVEQVFSNGLVKAAQNIDAWIVDGGTDAGVMAYVGKSIKDMAVSDVPCIGIAPLKKVLQQELLISDANSSKAVEYVADRPNSAELCALNPNHSHFLLVDSPNNTWGEEITFRTAFETCIRDKYKIPLVVITVNGGVFTLKNVVAAIERNFPVVVVQGSGRASDAIASLVQKAQIANKSLGPNVEPPVHTCNSLMEITDDGVDTSAWLELRQEAKGNLAKIDDWTRQMNLILKHLSLVTVFSTVDETSTDLDVYILRAILSSVNQDDKGLALEQKLKLGTMWNRPDIIEEILDDSKNDDDLDSAGKRKALNAALLYAIQLDRPQIFTLLVQNGGQKESIDLKKLYFLKSVKQYFRRLPEHGETRAFKVSLTKHKLDRNINDSSDVMWNQDQVKPVEMNHSSNAKTKKQGKEKEKEKNTSKYRRQSDRNVLFFRLVFMHIGPAFHSYYRSFIGPKALLQEDISNEEKKLIDEFNINHDQKVSFIDVLIWSVFVNRLEMAKEAWKQTTVPIHSALIACRLYRHLANHCADKEEYLANADWFEGEAIKIMGKMAYEDVKEGLLWKWEKMGNNTALDIAQDANAKKFMSHTHAQSFLDDCFYADEYGKVDPTTDSFKLWTGILFPLLIFLIYEHHEDGKSKLVYFYQFYRLPIVKFWTNTFFYCGFLFVQAYTLCTLNAGDNYNVSEIILWVWVFGRIVDEVSQFSKDPQHYFKYLSNYLDVLVVVLHIIYMVLRWTYHLTNKSDSTLISGSINVLVVACIFSWARLMNAFAISSHMGPLYFIIIRLFKDIFVWIFVFGIFAFSFQFGFVSLTKQVGMNPIDRYPYGTLPIAFFTIIGEYSYAAEWLSPAPLGVALLAIYAFIAQILLVNLLIAMMGDTYSNVSENSALEWKFYRLELMMENRSASFHPPPTNLFLPLWYLIVFSRSKLSQSRIIEIDEIDKKVRFKNVLKKMRISRDSVLDEEQQSEATSVSAIVNTLKDNLRTLANERVSDRKFAEKNFEDLRKTLSNQVVVPSGPATGNLQETIQKLQTANETLVLQNQQVLAILARQQEQMLALQQQLSAIIPQQRI